jgi:hypothetical protein
MALTRRRFLRGTLGATIGLPLLPSVHAGVEAGPRRLVVFYTPNGFHQSRADPQRPDEWTPVATGTDFELTPFLEPLTAHRDDVLVVTGLDQSVNPELSHDAVNVLLTGVPTVFAGLHGNIGGGPSFDQVVARTIADATRFPSLELGAFTHVSQFPRLSFRDAAEAVPTDDDPRSVFDRVFGDFVEPAPGDGSRPADILRERRLSVLDAVQAEFQAVSATASAEDRIRLEAHLDKIREIERTVADSAELDTTASCGLPDRPPAFDPDDTTRLPEVLRLQTELLAMSLVCDLTRVGTLVLGGGQSDIVYSWLGQTHSHHDITHDLADPGEDDISPWHAAQLAYLLDLLAAAPEGDGRVLDHTVVMWCTDVAGGFTHTHRDHAVVLAGGGGGFFRTGRHVRYGDGDALYNDLLLTLMHAMNVDADCFGSPQHCRGPLDALRQ